MVCMFFYYSYAKQKSALLEAGCNHDTGSRRSLGVDFSVKLWWLMYLVTRCILTCKIFKKFYKYKNLEQLLGTCNLRGITQFMIKKISTFQDWHTMFAYKSVGEEKVMNSLHWDTLLCFILWDRGVDILGVWWPLKAL